MANTLMKEITDNVNHPQHYETGKYECIEVMLETQGAAAAQEELNRSSFYMLFWVCHVVLF